MTTFTVSGADLHAAAQWAVRATPARPSAPVLAGLLLDAGDELTLTGYDFDTRASVVIPATTTAPGQMLLSGRLLASVAKTLDRQVDVTFSDEDGAGVTVRSGRSAEWMLPALPVHDYPQLPRLGDPVGAVVTGELRRALARVLPALARDDTLQMLTGVKVVSDGDRLTLVGTDRYRIAVATIDWQPTGDQDMDVLVPGSLLDTATKAAGGDADLVGLSCSGGSFGLTGESNLVTGRLLDVEFVPWRRVTASRSEHAATVDVASMQQALDQALIAAEEGRQVLVAFDGDGAHLSATGGGRRARASTTADLVGDPITVKVDATYLRAALGLHGSERVTIHFGSSPNKQMLVTGDDDSYEHTLMPVRITEAEQVAA